MHSVDALRVEARREPELTVMVRIYVTESQAKLSRLLQRLFETRKIPGLTVITGRAGLGTRTVLDPQQLATPEDPPLILEFFDRADRADETIRLICDLVAARHIARWPVEIVTPHRRG